MVDIAEGNQGIETRWTRAVDVLVENGCEDLSYYLVTPIRSGVRLLDGVGEVVATSQDMSINYKYLRETKLIQYH